MSEPDSPTRGELHHQQQLHQSSSQHNAADERDDANNSIIGKVKSRVSSIFPQKLTKWFSPSATTTTTSNGGVGRRRRRNLQCEQEEYERANNSDDESNNSAEDEEGASPAFTQPPTKRSRLNVEVTTTNFKGNQKLVSSTPTSGPRRRVTHLNLYGKQKEPAYSFGQSKYTTNTSRSVVTTKNSTVDSADIIEVVPDRNLLNTSISSRRSLNIPSTSSTDAYRNMYDLKRQSVSKLRTPGASPSSYTAQRTSTTILEIQDDDDDDDDDEQDKPGSQTMIVEEVDDDIEEEDDNEESEEIAKVTSKKQKFTNGNLAGRSSSVATESGESRSSSVAQTVPPKTGLFNPVNRGLRTFSGNGLNFYSNLEGRKSLFSEKNMPGMLNNSTLSLNSLNRRQFNSSIYGSTSALSDSRLLNTSSPFYKGQTTYGGAAAYGKFNRTLNQSVRIAPTLIRPTSSLSTLSSSTNSLVHGSDSAISSTAKRILELINDFSTPLNDAKKMASNIKTPAMLANRSASGGKRFSEADLATSRGVRLSTVRSPYTRPSVTLNPSSNDSKRVLPTLRELQVPSMSQLLQMKKMQSCTERSRQIANTSKSALNQECEYKLPRADESTSGDKNGSKHMSKIKHKLTSSSRVSLKNTIVEDEEAPAPANLPNIAFPFMQSVPKIDISVKSAAAQPKPPAKTDFKFAVSADAKPTNNFSFGAPRKALEGEKSPTPASPKPSMNFNFGTGSTVTHSPIAASGNEFKFSSPLSVSYTASKGDLAPINNFKFSSPLMVGAGHGEAQKVKPTSTSVPSTVPQLKTGSVLDALKKPTEKVLPITTKSPTTDATPIGSSLFGGQFKKPSNEWECSVCMIRNKESVESCVACTTPRTKPVAPVTSTLPPLSNALVKNTFGDAFKPQSNTWECDACMVRNKSDANECVACNTKKPGGSGCSATAPKLQNTDIGFKSLVAQQTASKWECDACMTRNDAERNKCVCCEQAKPGTQVVSDNVPKFSFGTSSASKFTFGFAGAKKEDELKAEAATKTETQTTGFTFGVPATTDVGSANAVVSSTGISFGVKPVAKTTSSAGEDVPDVVKSNATGFKFGFQPADSSKPDATAAAPTGFSFGIKSDAKPSSVKFNLPPTTAESKPASTSTSAITSTSSVSTTAAAPLFSSNATTVFGAPQKVEETKPASAEAKKLTTGFVFGAAASVPQPPTNQHTAAVKPMMFGSSSTLETNKTPPKVAFGSSTTTASPNSGFVFGKPAATAAPFTKSPSASSGFAFGKDQATSGAPALSMFGSAASSSTNVSKSTAPVFGSPAATSTAVSSSTTGFVFGKPATTTPMFGASSATTSATNSLFGSKSSALFTAASSSSAPTSTNSLTLAPSSALASTSVASSAPFVFGSGAASNALQSNNPIFGSSPFESASTAAAASTLTVPAASSWPTNTFTFGSSKPPEEVKSNAAPSPAFGSPSLFGQNTSIFGSAQVGEVKPNPAAQSAAPTFGAHSATTSVFGSNATSSQAGAVQQTSGSLFGSASSTPIFGSTRFGAAPAAAVAPVAPANTNNVPAAAPTFGSSSSFSSGFGSIAAASSSSGNGDGASAPKKADVAFNFGSAPNSGNSGFSFGSNNNNKPAADSVFKFTTSATPRFNFTGSTEPSNAAQPFQFGAPTSTPTVFNFGGVESNANTRITSVQSAGSSENAYINSPDNTAVDHSIGSRQWLRPIRDDKNNNTNTYINANAISSSSSSQKTSSQQASTIAATYKQQTDKEELSTFSSIQPPQQQPTQPATQLQQKPYHYKKSFLMQKYKFYRTSETEQSINSSSSSSNRSSKHSDGNGGDDDHHDPKDDTKNNDKPSAPYDRDQHDEVDYLTTDNVKTGDESTQTNSSIHSSNNNINSNPELQAHQHYYNNQFNNDSRGHQTVPQARSLPYKKFAPTTTSTSRSSSKYKLIRKSATSTTTSTSAAAKILRVPPKRLSNTSTLASKRTGNRASYLANPTTSITTNATAATISYPDSAKYKYIKKSQGN